MSPSLSSTRVARAATGYSPAGSLRPFFDDADPAPAEIEARTAQRPPARAPVGAYDTLALEHDVEWRVQVRRRAVLAFLPVGTIFALAVGLELLRRLG
jgi:hypothetical protein